MRTAQGVIFILVLGSAAMHGQTRLGTAADEGAILKNRDAQNAAFNKHDAKAYAALAAIDADRIDGAGTYSGREGIERYDANSWKTNPGTVKDEARSVRFVDRRRSHPRGRQRDHAPCQDHSEPRILRLCEAEQPVGDGCATRDSEAVEVGKAR